MNIYRIEVEAYAAYCFKIVARTTDGARTNIAAFLDVPVETCHVVATQSINEQVREIESCRTQAAA